MSFGTLLASTRSAQAQESTNLPATNSIWNAGVGEGFNAGAQELNLSAGVGVGMKILGSGRVHDWSLATFQYGWMIGGVVAPNYFFRGNVELLGEAFAGGQFQPSAAYITGIAPLLRYNFALGHRWVPFIDVGAGATATNIRDGDLSSTFEFNLQLGAGFRYFLRDDLALTAQYRFFHISDDNASSPNLGVNTSNVFFGVSWFF